MKWRNGILVTAGLALIAAECSAQQDMFRSRFSLFGGITRFAGEIDQAYEDIDPQRSGMIGVNYQRSLSYGTGLYGQYSFLRLSGNDIDNGNNARALNFLTEAHTFELGFNFRTDNGRWLKYDARFAPFFSIGVGAGMYNVFGDLYSANGLPYYYWSDGTIRDISESSPFAQVALAVEQDEIFDTELTNRRTEDNKPKDPYYLYIPAKLGLKWRVSDRLSADVFYAYNYTFADHLDDIHDAYPRTANLVNSYISNPTGSKEQRGDPNTNDQYHYAGLSLSWNFGRRSNDYRVTPIYIDHSTVETPSFLETAPHPIPPPPPVVAKKKEEPQVMNIIVEQITIGRLVVDTLVVTTLIENKPDTVIVENTVDFPPRKVLKEIPNPDRARMDRPIDPRLNTLQKNTTINAGIDTTRVNKMLSTWSISEDSLGVKIDSSKIKSDIILTPIRPSLKVDSIAPKVIITEPKSVAPADSLLENRMIPDQGTIEKSTTVTQPNADSLVLKEQIETAPDVLLPVIEIDEEDVPEVPPTPKIEPTPQQDQGSVTPKSDPVVPTTATPTPVAPSTPQTTQTTERNTPVPVVVPSGSNKALKDSIDDLNASNARLRATADSLARVKTAAVAARPTLEMTDSEFMKDARYRQHTEALNNVMVYRINTLEHYIALQEQEGNDSIVALQRARILELDKNIDRLRDSLNVAKERIKKVGVSANEALGNVVADPTLNSGITTSKAITDTVYFSTNSSSINSTKQDRIKLLAKSIRESKYGHVVVTGHSDKSGDDDDNLKLSRSRAETVALLLEGGGIPRGSIVTKGLGEKLAQHEHSDRERNVIIQVVLN